MLYIISGPAKSGKTTLRKEMLRNKKISGISTDMIRSALQTEKNLDIHYKNHPKKNAINIEKYLVGFINEILFFTDEDFIIEGDCISNGIYRKYKNNNQVKFIFIGYPDVSLKDKKFITIKKEKNKKSWVNDFSNQEVEVILSRGIDESKKIQKFCNKNSLVFINISDNFTKNINRFIKSI